MKLVCLSNGHGEDAIAVKILQELQYLDYPDQIVALPLVGEGYAYTKQGIPIIGPVQKMPSGGFIYMDNRQLWRDVQGGLIKLTWNQYQSLQHFLKQNPDSFILAVGDIVPLIFAWLTKVNYAFVGTAKSEYYLRDEAGWLQQTSQIERFWGSVYLPWERFLMSRRRCQAVFPRDTLTTKILQQFAIPGFDLGNPMIDDTILLSPLSKGYIPPTPLSKGGEEILTILLLPGSRTPEVERNWQVMIEAIYEVIKIYSEVIFVAAIAPALDLEYFRESLLNLNWKNEPLSDDNNPINDPEAEIFRYNKAQIILSQNAYANCLHLADLAIAMAGTATEQFVGLGKAVFTIPGQGPQFTFAFAEAQTRLLGCSVILVNSPQEMGVRIKSILTNPDFLNLIVKNGKQRMGDAGAANRIAQHLITQILAN
jgi:uncharacterized protein (TIGR03492 family)